MEITHFDFNSLQATTTTLEHARHLSGVTWIDVYPQDEGWAQAIENSFGLVVDEQHFQDTKNTQHPPFYDVTPHYDMLIFQALIKSDPAMGSFRVESAPIVFFVNHRVLVSVHTTDNTHFHTPRSRWLKGATVRAPLSGLGLLCLLLIGLTDQYLGLRVLFAQHLEHWQRLLLTRSSYFNNWPALLKASNELRHFRMNTVEPQEDTLDMLIDETDLELEPRIAVRLSDVLEHFTRVSRSTESLQNDLENLVQIYFSATNQRTNEIIRVLTIASVIFLPLNLLAGIYGMNFDHIPGSSISYGFYEVIAGMVGITALVLLALWFKRWL